MLSARVLAHTGCIDRFETETHFASYAGVAPIETAERRAHLIALQKVRHNREGGGDYYRRKLAAGKSHKDAMRFLKRRIASKLYRHMTADQIRRSAAKTATA